MGLRTTAVRTSTIDSIDIIGCSFFIKRLVVVYSKQGQRSLTSHNILIWSRCVSNPRQIVISSLLMLKERFSFYSIRKGLHLSNRNIWSPYSYLYRPCEEHPGARSQFLHVEIHAATGSLFLLRLLMLQTAVWRWAARGSRGLQSDGEPPGGAAVRLQSDGEPPGYTADR